MLNKGTMDQKRSMVPFLIHVDVFVKNFKKGVDSLAGKCYSN